LTETPKIKTNRFWDMESVRELCIKNNLYTCGGCEEYDRMLNMVKSVEPSTENLYRIAKDIVEHSDCQTISNVMFILEKAVTTTFEIENEHGGGQKGGEEDGKNME